jgi:hypothetical protein
MSTHHKMGMSRWTPWSICTHFDSEENNAQAKIGTDKHDKLCRVLNCDDTVEIDETDMLDRAVKWAANEIRGVCGDEVPFTEEKVTIKSTMSPVLADIHGTVDAFWIQHIDDELIIHIFDFKSMSQGGKDLWPQLKGYALGVACSLEDKDWKARTKVRVCMHILHGGIFKHEVEMTTLDECMNTGECIVTQRKNNSAMPHCPSSWCKYCKHASSCEATQTQIEVAKSGALMKFSAPKRLVLIEELEGILKKAKEEAKAEIALAPNKTIEDDGIAFAITQKNGPSSLSEGQALALFNACTSHGVTADDFMNICKLSKTDVMKLLQTKGGLKLKSKDKSLLTAELVVEPFFASKIVDKLERIK